MRQHRGDILEGDAGQQSSQQTVPLLEKRQIVIDIEIGLIWEQMPGLEVDESCRDEEKLRGDVQIEFAHLIEMGQVLRDDVGEADGRYVHLMTGDELEEKVKRALENRSLDFVGHRDRAFSSAVPGIVSASSRQACLWRRLADQ